MLLLKYKAKKQQVMTHEGPGSGGGTGYTVTIVNLC